MTAASAAVFVSGLARRRALHRGGLRTGLRARRRDGARRARRDLSGEIPARWREGRVDSGFARPERSGRAAHAGWPPGCPKGSGAKARPAGRRMDGDPPDGEFSGSHRVDMEDIQNTRPSRHRQTSVMRIDAPRSFYFPSGRLMSGGVRSRRSEHRRRKKIAACFLLHESCRDRREFSDPPGRRAVGGQNIELFAPAPED
jgi:hypothetical protein